jgi:hypothetical protein
MRKNQVVSFFAQVVAFQALITGCEPAGGGVNDIDFDLGFDFGDAYAAESITLTGTLAGMPVPMGSQSIPWFMQTRDGTADVLGIEIRNGSAASAQVVVIRLSGDFLVTGENVSFSDDFETTCNEPLGACPVEVLDPADGPDASAHRTTMATLNVHPNGDGTVTIHITAKSDAGDDIDLTLIAPVDAAGKLVRE